MPSRFIGVDEVIADAMSIIPGTTKSEKLLARQWSYIALREIGPSNDFVQVCTIYPHNLKLKKPDSLQSTLDIALYDSGHNELYNNYRSGKSRIHAKRRIGNSTVEDSEQSDGFAIELSEDDYSFNLGSNANNVAYAIVRFFEFPVDEDGLPKIPEKSRLAIMMFIRYMWTLRKNENRFDRDRAEVSWLNARNRARARGKMPSMLEYEAIAKSWMSMINKPNFDSF